MKTKMFAAVLVAAVTVPAFAQSTPVIDQRQANQEVRIQQGVASGQLTPREAGRLEAGQQRVENMETRAKADGVVTAGERARISQAQDVQSRRIAAVNCPPFSRKGPRSGPFFMGLRVKSANYAIYRNRHDKLRDSPVLP